MKPVSRILADLWAHVGGGPEALGSIHLEGVKPGLPSSFRVGAVAQTTIAAVALMAAKRHERRSGNQQTVSVSMDHAVAEFQSERFVSLDGQVMRGFRDPLAGIFPCRDGGWFRPHITFPHHKRILLDILGIRGEPDRETFGNAIAVLDALSLEEAVIENGGVGAALRTMEDWDQHPQASAVDREPLVRIERIGENAKTFDGRYDTTMPLSRVRVLDLTRVIAGPVCGRVLATFGADVLAISSRNLPSVPQLVLDNNRGKRSADLDLGTEAGMQKLA